MIQQFAYVHGVARISLLSGKNTEYKMRLHYFLSLSNTATPLTMKSPIKNHTILFELGQVVELDKTKLGSTKPNKSPTWRLVQSPTSTAILQITIPHPCNSSSCPQVRRPIEAAHSFNFSIVTPLVSMSVGFLDPQIFSSITSLSLTR